jgi:hypothetical protein
MSAYQSQNTLFKDEECLIKALTENGFTREQIEVHEIPQTLIDYHGQIRPQRGTIIIRRKYVGKLANDIGFDKNAEGFYEAHVSDYEKRIKHGPVWMTAVKKSYAEHGLIKQSACMGLVYLGKVIDEVTNKPKLQFGVQG